MDDRSACQYATGRWRWHRGNERQMCHTSRENARCTITRRASSRRLAALWNVNIAHKTSQRLYEEARKMNGGKAPFSLSPLPASRSFIGPWINPEKHLYPWWYSDVPARIEIHFRDHLRYRRARASEGERGWGRGVERKGRNKNFYVHI